MSLRRVTVDLPSDLLDAALRATGKGVTETLIEGLKEVRQRRFCDRALALRGRIHIAVDVNVVRGR